MSDARSHPPILYVLSGPSGVGKDAVLARLRAAMPEIHVAVTCTTRPARPGEENGQSYYFLDQVEYDRLLDAGELLAAAEVHGHWYGVPIVQVRQAFQRGRDVLLKIDVQGALQVQHRFPDAVFIFIAPPTMDALLQRLRARQTEIGAELERRIHDTLFEMDQQHHYHYSVINQDDDIDGTMHNVCCVITAERMRTLRPALVL